MRNVGWPSSLWQVRTSQRGNQLSSLSQLLPWTLVLTPPAMDYCWKCKLKSSFCPHHLWPWHCITATGKELAEELMGLLLWWTWAHCLGRLWKGLQLWAGKVIKSSELNRLFCGAMEDKNVGEILDSGGLSCEVYKWRKDHFVRFWIKNL